MKEFATKPEDPEDSPNKPGQFELFTKVIKAGRKTFFFDIRQSRSDEHYLVITESTKKIDDDGKSFYKRHKIFVSREDLLEFRRGLDQAIDFIATIEEPVKFPKRTFNHDRTEKTPEITAGSTIVDFDDIGRVKEQIQ